MALKIDHVNYIYDADTEMAHTALEDINIEIPNGQFIGLIGHTGSGKSTLVTHLNGLVKPTSGRVLYDDQDINDKNYDRKKLRSKVGLVFQYPEHQLFETDVFADVCFGPKNLGLSKDEVEKRAYEALRMVGLSDDFYKQSPFDLSGGQKRRVAIAGVLAMEPEILVLDEPTAGLDPKGKNEILDLLKKLHEQRGITVVLVSHSMEDVANYVDRIIVMDHGKVQFDGQPREVFAHYKELEKMGLAAPQVTYIMKDLKEKGFNVDDTVTTLEEATDDIMKEFS
ncbi:MAG: energy-coupling factor transporter ATPase [Butyrivibrio sp.]|uniref:energy-coupling factor transporter ATPase n=1 Tax=Butyrivibrio sp. TaxID=28121 RepID=UPI0025D4A1CE|nr:energy-coupling factor transporter ATPase [Butyrivibrio sp.]MCR5772707.1 energy-coupling factor transporter ATPase [Butyrivibrio sp.]